MLHAVDCIRPNQKLNYLRNNLKHAFGCLGETWIGFGREIDIGTSLD